MQLPWLLVPLVPAAAMLESPHLVQISLVDPHRMEEHVLGLGNPLLAHSVLLARVRFADVAPFYPDFEQSRMELLVEERMLGH